MNTLRIMPIRNTLLTLLVVSAFIVDAARAAEFGGPMPLDCGHRYISQAEAGRLLGTDNFLQTWAARQRFYARLARACAASRQPARAAETAVRKAAGRAYAY